MGGTQCRCGQNIGFGAEANSRLKERGNTKLTLNIENESQKSYIYQDPDIYDGMKIRGLNDLTKLIGQIITHLMVLGAHMLSDENT